MVRADGMESRSIPVGGRTVEFLSRSADATTAAATTVLAVGVTAGESEAWQDLLGALPAELRVLAVDGELDAEALTEVFAALDAEALTEVFAALDVQQAHLVAPADMACTVLAAMERSAQRSVTLIDPTADIAGPLGTLSARSRVPAVLWVRSDADAAVDPAVAAAFADYRRAGGEVSEAVLPRDDRAPLSMRRALLEVTGYIGHPAWPAPPTEAIILSSSD